MAMIDKVITENRGKKTDLYIKFSDGTFVATEIRHDMDKKKLAKAINDFAIFIHGESLKQN